MRTHAHAGAHAGRCTTEMLTSTRVPVLAQLLQGQGLQNQPHEGLHSPHCQRQMPRLNFHTHIYTSFPPFFISVPHFNYKPPNLRIISIDRFWTGNKSIRTNSNSGYTHHLVACTRTHTHPPTYPHPYTHTGHRLRFPWRQHLHRLHVSEINEQQASDPIFLQTR